MNPPDPPESSHQTYVLFDAADFFIDPPPIPAGKHAWVTVSSGFGSWLQVVRGTYYFKITTSLPPATVGIHTRRGSLHDIAYAHHICGVTNLLRPLYLIEGVFDILTDGRLFLKLCHHINSGKGPIFVECLRFEVNLWYARHDVPSPPLDREPATN
jgi:hypothetical protein